MKNKFLLPALFVVASLTSYSQVLGKQDDSLNQDHKAQIEFVDRFLAQLPEDSFLRKQFEQGSCSHCGDVAVAVYLLKSDKKRIRKIGSDIFYNAMLVVFSHGQLTPQEVLAEVQQAEQAVRNL